MHRHQLTASLLLLSIFGGAEASQLSPLPLSAENHIEEDHEIFVCAQACHRAEKFEEALKWYRIRIEKGGTSDEVWFSKLMMGDCHDRLGDWETALSYYLEASKDRPMYSEPLHRLSVHYRHTGENNLAYQYAKQGSVIPFPEKPSRLLCRSIYDYQFDEELSVVAYYAGHRNDGFDAVNRILLSRAAPYHVKERAYINVLYYVPTLTHAQYDSIQIELAKLNDGEDTYHAMNPSIMTVDDGYLVLVRTVNFKQTQGRAYRSRDRLDPVIRTKNYLVRYDKNLNLISQTEIVENLPRYRMDPLPTVGMEDCRLFKWNDDLWLTCVVYDTMPTGVPQQALCKLSRDAIDNKVEVERLIPLIGPDPNRCEKNWLPFIKDDQLQVIYSCDPFVIYRPDLANGACPEILSYTPKHDFSSFRGSASPIEFDDGYLILIHQVSFTEQRNYLHRFAYLDKDMQVLKLSKPFQFLHQGIEYSCGMTIDHSGSRLIIPIGVEDSNAYLCTLELDQVRSMLEKL
jgi:predicted GH43/DUF377 family glycosyl hydrolase